MNVGDLEKLNYAVEFIVNQESFSKTIDQLSDDIRHSHGPFVWSVIDLDSIDPDLPENIKSCWIFVLKRDVPSGCHFHPNSIQHMAVIKGQGMSKVGSKHERLIKFGSSSSSMADIWCVIGEGVPHEFFPEEEDMIVVSFHTCEASDLEEISCDTGKTRLYEGD